MNQKITLFLASILSDAAAEPGGGAGGDAPGKRGRKGVPRSEVPASDPPELLKFLSETPVLVPEGTTKIVKFKSDARPPRYSFHGQNPRCFATLDLSGVRSSQLTISGRADIDGRGYGSVTISCSEDPIDATETEVLVGRLIVSLQSTDGRTLSAEVAIGIGPKPEQRERKRRQSVRPEINFCATANADKEYLAALFVEKTIAPFGSYLEKYRDALVIRESECAYWGERCERSGESWLIVEINVGHPQLMALLKDCATAEERVRMKERVVQDIVLDCYQHIFHLDDVAELVHESVVTDPDDLRRASEICLNFDKNIRTARIRRGIRSEE